MAKDFARAFYKSSAWHKARAAYIAHRIAIDGGLCEVCHKELGYIVHHKIELTPKNINDPSISLGFFNMQYVCHRCHNEIHQVFKENERKVMFDPNGDVIFPPNTPH